ncbi:hypothetical protein CEXT_774931 [Caerostris extrusa]|uniref:Uncharacterized protein n=1 Tax=Caerostris extrusa TaxID=172846 RepID=A0AAV4SKW5_CAEEX|nr:hypothetical protein CEXT_774931 [Caerostris extrusa]
MRRKWSSVSDNRLQRTGRREDILSALPPQPPIRGDASSFYAGLHLRKKEAKQEKQRGCGFPPDFLHERLKAGQLPPIMVCPPSTTRFLSCRCSSLKRTKN